MIVGSKEADEPVDALDEHFNREIKRLKIFAENAVSLNGMPMLPQDPSSPDGASKQAQLKDSVRKNKKTGKGSKGLNMDD